MHLSISWWRLLLLLIALAPLVYYVTGSLAALRFFKRERAKVLPDYTPPVSLLKPVRGLDFDSYENFVSFCQLDYPEYEILFCVNEMSDSAVQVIQRLMAEYPEQRIRILSDAPQIGSNRKVNNLALLTREAQYEIVVQSDGDVRVGPQYLHEVVAPLADCSVGATSCFYRGIVERNLGAELEAVGATSDFFAGALIADWKEGVTFALGASVATTKTWLERIGGYQSLANLLADDYEIGNRIYKAGGKVLLSREPVWTSYPAQTAKGFWEHQIRWARTIRFCRPISFLGLIFTHGLPWAIVAAIVAPNRLIAAAYLLAYLVLRFLMAWVVGVWGIGDEILSQKMWLVPLRDAVYFIVWLSSFASNRVTWGDARFMLKRGEMTEIGSSAKTAKT
ncbi:MAG TPA: bacteriohopanetetrol glucosamine biosynthesis glycosyltransferase HpnI [Candidatus Acidoferrum sp.]|nr:bacteriohopanetetrol glucosamine biosynthesis glycosyltransferase HpnI [Candidatus Acidoferrum sp.]